jgi:hypothetical protein
MAPKSTIVVFAGTNLDWFFAGVPVYFLCERMSRVLVSLHKPWLVTVQLASFPIVVVSTLVDKPLVKYLISYNRSRNYENISAGI